MWINLLCCYYCFPWCFGFFCLFPLFHVFFQLHGVYNCLIIIWHPAFCIGWLSLIASFSSFLVWFLVLLLYRKSSEKKSRKKRKNKRETQKKKYHRSRKLSFYFSVLWLVICLHLSLYLFLIWYDAMQPRIIFYFILIFSFFSWFLFFTRWFLALDS